MAESFFCSIHPEPWFSQHSWDKCYALKKIFSPENFGEIIRTFAQTSASFGKKFLLLRFLRKTPFLPKMGENGIKL
jgi:hypothetical protein